MGNLLYVALRLVLGAQTSPVCRVLLSTLSPTGGFQRCCFFVFFFWWGRGMVFK